MFTGGIFWDSGADPLDHAVLPTLATARQTLLCRGALVVDMHIQMRTQDNAACCCLVPYPDQLLACGHVIPSQQCERAIVPRGTNETKSTMQPTNGGD